MGTMGWPESIEAVSPNRVCFILLEIHSSQFACIGKAKFAGPSLFLILSNYSLIFRLCEKICR